MEWSKKNKPCLIFWVIFWQKTHFSLSFFRSLQDVACSVFVYNLELIGGHKCDLVQLWAVSAERLTVVADTARRLPVWGQRVYVGQPWACMLWQQHGHCAVQQDRDWSGQREPAWREAPLTRQHRYFLICPLKHFDIIRPHRATSTLIILTFATAAKWAKRSKRRRNRQKYWTHQIMVHIWDVGMVIWWAVLSYWGCSITPSLQTWQYRATETLDCQKITTAAAGKPASQFITQGLKNEENYLENQQKSYFPQVQRVLIVIISKSSLFKY